MAAKNQQQQSVNAAAAAATEISSQSSSSVLPPAGSGDNRVSVPAGSAAQQQQPRRPGVSSKSHVCLPACLTTYQIVLQVVMLKWCWLMLRSISLNIIRWLQPVTLLWSSCGCRVMLLPFIPESNGDAYNNASQCLCLVFWPPSPHTYTHTLTTTAAVCSRHFTLYFTDSSCRLMWLCSVGVVLYCLTSFYSLSLSDHHCLLWP